jgi:tRNA(Met) cytidine acetyltransferase
VGTEPVAAHGRESTAWLALTPERARACLGSECDCLVFDAGDGFHADAFGAVSGTLVGGGSLLLLLPADTRRGGRFQQRVADVFGAGGGEGNGAVRVRHAAAPGDTGAAPARDPAALTADQAAAVDAVIRVARGHRRRPLVLTADRGRGKSAALGIAAARLLAAGLETILVTAPSRLAVESLFARARELAPGLAEDRLRFVPPDVLLRQPHDPDLLLVDEAAALPVGVLERLLRQHSRVVFATTVHGYEGSGRGFDVRFRPILAAVTPQWRALRLETPVRWAPGDPLEAAVYRALLLDAEPADVRRPDGSAARGLRVVRLERGDLAADETLLREVFGLLVLAHYQTRPSDLQRLLDEPDLDVWAVFADGRVAATALVAAEGGLEPALAEAVARGERRPRGHLLAQTLAAHAGFAAAARLRYARVMRIAVHPAAQRTGLGRMLLEALSDHYRGTRDFIGASFGMTTGLARFWRRGGCLPVRLGMRRDPASGMHSLVVLRALGGAGVQQLAVLRGALADRLPWVLRDGLEDLEPGLVSALVQGLEPVPERGTDRETVRRYAAGEADYAQALPALGRAAWNRLAGAAPLEATERALLVAKLVQQRPWADVARACGFTGRPAAEAALRRLAGRLCDALPPAE